MEYYGPSLEESSNIRCKKCGLTTNEKVTKVEKEEKQIIDGDEGLYHCYECEETYHPGCGACHVLEELERNGKELPPCDSCNKELVTLVYVKCKQDGKVYHTSCVNNDMMSLLKSRVILTSRMIDYWAVEKVDLTQKEKKVAPLI